MNKLQTAVEATRNFVSEVVEETKKSTWPARQELIESTIVVIVSVLILTVAVGVGDKLMVLLLKLVMPQS